MHAFLLYYRYNFTCFWNRLRNGLLRKQSFSAPKIAELQAQCEGPYNPFMLCRTFIAFCGRLRLFYLGSAEKLQIKGPFSLGFISG